MRVLFALLAIAIGCAGHDHTHDDHEHDVGEDPRPALSFTDWTETTELFIELRALVVGQDSPCAAHVTKLEGFVAPAEGRVTVTLRGGPNEETFVAEAATQPGIFRPVARPTSAGTRRLIVRIEAAGVVAEHDLGDVTVFASVEAAVEGIPEEPDAAGLITFLKEQQWPIPFATAVVAERSLRPSLRVHGAVRARPDGELVVAAPVAGRLSSLDGAFPHLGDRVEVDALLGVIAPRLEAADLASLELAVRSGELEVGFAQRERERLETLRGEGAVPERRVQDALHAAEEAQASLSAAQRRLGQFRRVQRPGGRGEGTVQLRAPFAGTITAIDAAPGAFVEAGAPLFRITDLERVFIEARVPEVDVPAVATVDAGWFTPEGSEHPIELAPGSLVARGGALDDTSRTLPLAFSFDNTTAHLPIGAFVDVFLATGPARVVTAVPGSAIVDDSGTPVVFVQVEGEAFARRIVRLGAREGDFVEIESGLTTGEHVVTTGAYSVKLAASSGSVPAHGHSH